MPNWMFLSALLAFAPYVGHEYYVSVFEIEIKDKQQIVELSGKLFTDDLELALSNFHEVTVRMDTLSLGEGKKWLLPYLQEHIRLKGKTASAKWQWVGFESNPDVTFVYLEAIECPVSELVPLRLTVFFDQYPAQINIAHVKRSGNERSAMFSIRNQQVELKI